MPAGSYVKRMPWGQQKPPVGFGIDWSHPLAPKKLCVIHNELTGLPSNLVDGRQAITTGSPKWLSKPNTQGRYYNNTNDLDTYTSPFRANSPISVIVTATVDDVTPTYRKRAVRVYGSNGSAFIIEFGDGSSYSKLIAASLQDTPNNYNYAYGDTFEINKRYVVAATWVPNDYIKLYINGVMAAVSSAKPAVIVGITNTTLGNNRADTGLHLRGLIDNAFIDDRAYSKHEINYLYENPYCFIEGWNYGRVYSVPSGAFINSSYWYQNPIMEAI